MASPSGESNGKEGSPADLQEGFIAVFLNKVDQILMRDGSDFRLEDEERKVLMEVNSLGLMKGVLAGTLSFVLVRWTRPRLIKSYNQWRTTLLKKQQQQQSPPGTHRDIHVQNSPFQSSSTAGNPVTGQSWTPPPLQPRSFFSLPGLFLLEVDLLTSFIVAVTVSVIFTDKKKVMGKLADLPLLPGRSRLAEEFCPAVLAEWRRLEEREAQGLRRSQPKHQDGLSSSRSLRDKFHNPESILLAGLLDFHDNCQRRQAYQRRLRREQGLGPHDPVSIPALGVPVDDDSLLLRDDDDDKNDGDTQPPWQEQGDFYEPLEQEGDWADSMVTDQEDERRR